MPKDTNESQIRLTREVGDITIEVALENSDEFDDALALLNKLANRILVSEAKEKLQHIWTNDEGIRRMNEFVHESKYRVVLSLLEEWPECRNTKAVASETGLHEGSVYKLLTGRRGDSALWFRKCHDGWTLSNRGVKAALNDIVPELSIGNV